MLNFFKPIGSLSNNGAAVGRSKLSKSSLLPPQKKAKLSSQAVIDIAAETDKPHARVQPEVDRPAVFQTEAALSKTKLQDSKEDVVHSTDTTAEADDLDTVVNRQEAGLRKAVPHPAAEVQAAPLNVIQTNATAVRRFKGVPYMPDAGSVSFLTNMGFGNDQAVRALKVTQGNIERAANWLLSGL